MNIILRERVVDLFTSRPDLSAKSREVAQILNIRNNQEYQSLRSILHKLVDNGTLIFDLVKGYKLQVDKNHNKGKITLLKNNFGLVKINSPKLKEILIPPQLLSTALDGDLVEVDTFSRTANFDNKVYAEGKVLRIVDRAEHKFIGTVAKTKNTTFVIPDDKKLKRDFYIPENFTQNVKSGDKVLVELIEWESDDFNPEGKIIEILGKAGDPFAEIRAVLKTFNLDPNFPKNVEKEVANISSVISEKEILEREDCRNLEIVTIDPIDAKDFDDALSIEIIDENIFELGVHIADVSQFVKPNSELDAEALKRGTSFYLANQVIPMLPEKLSNNLCSLKPNTDRLAFSCFVKIKNSKIESYRFAKTVIHSKKRFTYEEVENILDKPAGKFSKIILKLWEVASKLREDRFKKGGIDFETLEPKFKYDASGKPLEIFIKHRLKSHMLVEECMLLANKLVATQIKNILYRNEPAPFVYRVHAIPEIEKLKTLSLFVTKLGFKFNISKNLHNEFQSLLKQVENKPEENIVNEVALRSMAKAIYETENVGHFGLAFQNYTHFTSPIRRYPDLLVHRLLNYYLSVDKNKNQISKLLYSLENLNDMCKHSSAREKIAQEAERDTIKIMQLEYMKNHVGEDYEAIISGVLNFGFFVELNETLVEGLVHARTLKDDYYEFDERNYSLKGKRTGKVYRLGDKVKVKVISVNPENKKIDFNIIEESKSLNKGLLYKRKK